MRLYRFAKQEFADDVSGTGGVYFGGRWHEQGVPCMYTSTHISLAVLEMLANKRWHTVPGLCLVSLELPAAAVIRLVSTSQLSPYWQMPVPYDGSTIRLGTDFLRKGTEAALQVPSALVPQEFNLILSPHRAAAVGLRVVSVEAFALDTRLVV